MPNYEIDMSKGSIFKNLIRFALPLMLTNLLQILYNTADTVVAGRFEGSDALAAIGATSYLHNLIVNLFLGLSIGAGVVVSKKFGAKDNPGLQKTVHTTVALGGIMGVACMIVGLLFCKPLLGVMGTPSDVIDTSALYMRIVFLGIPAAMVYNFCGAILRSVGDSKRPLYILSATGLLNVILNIVFIVCLRWGVVGVALATVIANYVSALAVLYVLIKSDTSYKLKLKELTLDKKDTVEIVKIGLPAGLQSCMFSLSNMVIQWALNGLGSGAVAGNAAAYSIEYFGYILVVSLYQATLISVGQNYGAKEKKRIYKTMRISVLCGFLVGMVFGVLVTVFARQLLGIYITDSREAIEYGVQRILIGVLPYAICGVMEQFAGLLRGVGKSLIPAINTLVGTCALRLVWVFFVFPHNPLGNEYAVLWLYTCYPISWTICTLMHIVTFLVIRKNVMKKMLEI